MGNFFSYENSYNLFLKQLKFENQRLAYSKLMSLKRPLTQTLVTHYEASALSEYYDTRFRNFSKNESDRLDARKENDRQIALIPEISKLNRELYETLGTIQISYEIDSTLQTAIDDLYDQETFMVNRFPNTFLTVSQLDAHLTLTTNEARQKVDEYYGKKLEKIIKLLRSRMEE